MNRDTSIGDIAAVLLGAGTSGAVTSSWIDGVCLRGCSFSSCSVASPETTSLLRTGFSKLSSKEPSYSVEDTDSSCLWLVIDFKREVKERERPAALRKGWEPPRPNPVRLEEGILFSSDSSTFLVFSLEVLEGIISSEETVILDSSFSSTGRTTLFLATSCLETFSSKESACCSAGMSFAGWAETTTSWCCSAWIGDCSSAVTSILLSAACVEAEIWGASVNSISERRAAKREANSGLSLKGCCSWVCASLYTLSASTWRCRSFWFSIKCAATVSA